MIRIGLTGGIGSGKSTLAKYLSDKGIPIIDADKISREIYFIYPQCVKDVRKAFGNKFFNEKGQLKRKELGKVVFKYKGKRKKLERILMPYIKKEIFKRMNKKQEENSDVCVLDAPTLIENNLHKKMDFNILVYVDLKTQIKRVMARDNLSYEETLNRINSQMPLKKKKKKVEYIIDNSGILEGSYKQLENVLSNIMRNSI